MFTIGDFARSGRVSVRMLRHYDRLGLLVPAYVDDSTGYRYYQGHQLARLNRIVALKDLGFTLAQVAVILDAQVSTEELRGMLRLRRAELQTQLAADAARLSHVEARLRIIESEGLMPTDDVIIKQIPPTKVAELTAVAASYAPEDITPVITPLYDELVDKLDAAGVTTTGPGIAYYEDAPDGEGAIVVHATIQVAVEPGDRGGFTVVDLPEIARAATIIHRGSMDEVMPTAQTLGRWIEANGYKSAGYARELYLECPPGELDRWVTELQEPLVS